MNLFSSNHESKENHKTVGSTDIRRYILTVVQIFLIILMFGIIVIVSMVNPENSLTRDVYTKLIIGLLVILVIAFALNRTGNYRSSAGLTVLCSIIGPWGSFLMDPAIYYYGDIFPLVYVTISVLLSSIFLSFSITIILTVLQIAALIGVVISSPAPGLINWSSFLIYVFVISIIGITMNYINKHYSGKLLEYSIRDHLTGLFNRRYFEATLYKKIQKVKNTIGLIMVDIDYFKSFNDQYGHEAGDLILQSIGACLSKQANISDVVCRYGGDEFFIIVTGYTFSATKEFAETLRLKIKQINIKYNGTNLNMFSVSIGIAIFPQHGTSYSDLIAAADTALFQAKRDGRDQIAVFYLEN